MTIYSKTRKLLWAKSNNKCAICKCDLSLSNKDTHTIIGDECHIRSPKLNGPRYDIKYPKTNLHHVDNLILLCKKDHKIIDDNPQQYTIEKLIALKNSNNNGFNNSLEERINNFKVIKTTKTIDVNQITSGKELLDIGRGLHGFSYHYDEPNTYEEKEVIKEIIEIISNFDVILDDVGYTIDLAFDLTNTIIKLNQFGLYLYGNKVNDRIKNDDGIWVNGIFLILRVNKKSLNVPR